MSTLLRRLLVFALLLVLVTVAAPVRAQTADFCAPGQEPQLVLGFSALAARLGKDIVGEPVECEHYSPDGDAFQLTTEGEFFYDSATNTPVFSTADRHWALTGRGLVTWVGLASLPPEDAEIVTGPITPGTPSVPRAEQPITATLIDAQDNIVGTIKMENVLGGNMAVSVQAAGFDPVAGGHRLSISDIGRCVPPSFTSAGEEIIILPDVEFYSDGTTIYQVVVERQDEAIFDDDGSALLLHASDEAGSDVIACAEIVPLEGGLIIDDSAEDILVNPSIYLGRSVAVTGVVVQSLAPLVFSINSDGDAGAVQLLVLGDPVSIPALDVEVGDEVTVTGTIIILTAAEIQRRPTVNSGQLNSWIGSPAIVAQNVDVQ